MLKDIHKIRREYNKSALTVSTVLEDPIAQFKSWFNEALASEVLEPNAMTLCTVNSEGRPSSRIVLLKGVEDEGFVFFTNYESRKGRELLQKPYGALTFFWAELERQVRIEGRVQKIPEKASDEYYASRPHGSKLGAWISAQSEVIPSREVLLDKLKEIGIIYKDKEPERPSFWGGYSLVPDRIEFWQGRPNRLHDRILYTYDEGKWQIVRLSP